MTDFLPPVILKLGADVSDLTAGLAEAAAQVQAFADLMPTVLGPTAVAAGTEGHDAGKAYADGLTDGAKDVGGRVGRDVSNQLRDARGRFMSAATDLGRSFTDSFQQSTKNSFIEAIKTNFAAGNLKELGESISGSFMSIAGTAAAVLSPLIAAGIGGAIISGVGLGTIGAGAAILHNAPPIVAAVTQLKNDVTSIFKDAASPLQGPFVDSLHLLDSTAKQLAPQFKQMFAAVAPAVVPLTQGITGLITNAMPGLVQVAQASAPFLTQLAQYLPGLGKDISAFLSTIAKNGPVALEIFKSALGLFEGVLGVFNALLNTAGFLYSGFGKVRDFLESLPGKAKAAWSAVSGFFSDLGSKIADFTSTAWSKVTGFFDQVGSKVSNFVSGVGSAVGNFFTQTIPGWIDTAADFVRSLPGKIEAGLKALPGLLKQAATQAFDAFFTAVGFGIGKIIVETKKLPGQVESVFRSMWSTTKQLVSQGVNSTVSFFQQLPGRAVAFANKLRTDVDSAISQLWSDAKQAFSDGVSSVVGFASSLYDKVKSWFMQTRDTATSTTSNMVSSVVGFFESLPGKALTEVQKLPGVIKGAVSDAGNWLYQAGRDVVSGLINGVESMISSAISAVKRAMGDVVSGAKKALGIASPSTVFAEIGGHVVGGFVQGVQTNASAAASAVAGMLRFGTGAGLGTTLGGLGAGVTAAPGATTPVPAAQTLTVNLINQLTLLMDGRQIHARLIAPAQQYKLRTGTTGLA